jgi:PEP-CTERM motif
MYCLELLDLENPAIDDLQDGVFGMFMKRLVKSVVSATVAVTAVSAFAATTNPVLQWDWQMTSGFTAWQDTLWNPATSLTDTTFIKTAPTPGYALKDANGNPLTGYNSLTWGKGTLNGNAACGATPMRQGRCQGNDPGTSTLSVNNPTTSPPYITAAGVTAGPTGPLTQGVFGNYSEIGRFTFADNPVLASSAFLDKATYTANIVLRANGDATAFSALQTQAAQVQIDFFETNNPGDLFGSTVRCAAGTGSGASGTDVGAGCGDIFVISGNITNVLTKELIKDGFKYTFNSDFFVLNADGSETKANTLSGEACALAGLASGCYGFVTREGVATNIALRSRVLVTALSLTVPEPATLGILGLGLAGLGFARRRKI